MTTSRIIYDGSEFICDSDEDHATVLRDQGPHVPARDVCAYAGDTCARLGPSKPFSQIHDYHNHRQHVNLHEPDVIEPGQLQQKHRLSFMAPQEVGLTDRNLLPSQRQQKQSPFPDPSFASAMGKGPDHTFAQVEPSSNPYHWEVPASNQNTISVWAKASWVRTNEIVRQQAGTLKRKTAVRRRRQEPTILPTDSVMDGMSTIQAPTVERNAVFHDSMLYKPELHRSFSFEDEEQRRYASIVWEQAEENTVSKPWSGSRVDSGIVQNAEGRSSQFRKELDNRPGIARTFSEMLGSGSFIPTALLDGD